MKLVRAISLSHQDGPVHRLLEIDLCEVGGGRYVVNFRHGRAGQALRDGTQTALPVSLAEAERVLARLLDEKRAQGFVQTRQVGATLTDISTASDRASAISQARSAREQPVADARAWLLEMLSAPTRWKQSCWTLGRLAWRVGELRLRPAARPLMEHGLPRRRKPLETYSVAWALGRCGDPSALDTLARLRADARQPESVRRIATHSAFMLLDDAQRGLEAQRLRSALPFGVARTLGTDEWVSALEAWLGGDDPRRYALLESLYVIAWLDRSRGAPIRSALLDALQKAPFAPPALRYIRRVFKLAEHRGDPDVFGLLTRRFSVEPSQTQSQRAAANRQSAADRPVSGLAWSEGTARYMKRRAWRWLRRLGADGSSEYVAMAAGVVLAMTNADLGTEIAEGGAAYPETYTVAWGRFWALGHILSDNHHTRVGDRRALLWGRQSVPMRAPRAEAFATLWDAHPLALLSLLKRSRCRPVHTFAATALLGNRSAWSQLDADDITDLLSRPYPETVALATDIAIARYDPRHPNRGWVRALAQAPHARARETAHGWIRSHLGFFLREPAFVAALATSVHPDTRRFLQDVLRHAPLSEDEKRSVATHLIAAIEALDGSETDARARVDDAIETLVRACRPLLARWDLTDLHRLIKSPSAAAQRVAGLILEDHTADAGSLPESLIADAMTADDSGCRAAGVRRFGRLSDLVLRERHTVLLHLAAQGDAEVRAALTPVIKRLAFGHRVFAHSMLSSLIEILRQPEPDEGRHASTVRLLRDALGDALAKADSDAVWRLLQSPSGAAVELGAELMQSRIDPAALSVEQIVGLTGHEALCVRRSAWEMCRGQIRRLEAEMAVAIGLLESEWEDSRQFAFALFRERVEPSAISPDVLIAICDSQRADVQQFGRSLITRLFEHRHGPAYLLKLSQHPAHDMQLFATNYLERYAAGEIERIMALEPYFESVLCAVHRGRVAKTRVGAFLRAEARKSQAAAALAARIFGKQSSTVLIGDRSVAIEALLEIRALHPDLDVPLRVRAPARRGARAV